MMLLKGSGPLSFLAVAAVTLVTAQPVVLARPSQAPKFSVYVAAPLRDGFQDVSKDTSDTIKDIANAVKHDDRLTLVTRKEDADVVLVVIGRGIGSETFGQRTSVYRNYYGGTSVQSLPMVANTRWITTVLISGTYQREFAAAVTNTSSFSLGAWSENAGKIVDNIGAWVSTNAEALQARRGKTESVAPASGAGQAPAAESSRVSLTIDQVVQMVTAKLPDDLILTTIRNSGTRLDLTADALLKLKAAGASDAVIRALSK